MPKNFLRIDGWLISFLFRISGSNILAEELKLFVRSLNSCEFFRTQQALGSNLGPQTNCSDRWFSWMFHSVQVSVM
jgi:hypothetical protein